MKKDVIQYLQSQLALGPQRLKGYAFDVDNKPYPKRSIYEKIKDYFLKFSQGRVEQRWLLIPGLRGVGKTTLLAQLFLDQAHDPMRVLYISLDEITQLLGSTLAETLSAYETILGQSFESLTAPIYLFIDEVQYDPKWGITLKSIYDRSKKIFICCTGSSAIALQTNPDVQRRALFERLLPLSFTEHQLLKHGIPCPEDVTQEMKVSLFFSETLLETHKKLQKLSPEIFRYWSLIDRQEIQHYQTMGTLPFTLPFTNPAHVFESLHGLLDKIIQKDIENLNAFDPPTLHGMKRLLLLLAEAGDTISVNKLLNLTGMNSSQTIHRVLSTLEQAALIIRILPVGSKTTQSKKPSKFLFLSSSIRMALLGLVGKEATYETRMGKLLEDIAGLVFYRILGVTGAAELCYDPEQGGADFVLQILNSRQIVVEIGSGAKEKTQVLKTMKKYGADHGLVIGHHPLALDQKDSILRLPLDYFYLL